MQVQTQLFCTGANYCDFIVYTKESIHIERIQPDNSFWEENVRRQRSFLKLGSCQNCLEGGFPALQNKLCHHYLLPVTYLPIVVVKQHRHHHMALA